MASYVQLRYGDSNHNIRININRSGTGRLLLNSRALEIERMGANEQKKPQNETLCDRKRKKDNSLWRVLNSPFVVTALAGLVLMVLTVHLQNKAARIEQERARIFQKWEQKRTAFASFSKNFGKSAKYAIEYKYREIWIVKHRKDENREDLVFEDDLKSYKDTVQRYHELLAEYCEINSDTLYAMVSSIFDSEEVVTKARDLYERMNRLTAANSVEDVHTEYKIADKEYKEIIELMAREIKGYYKE